MTCLGARDVNVKPHDDKGWERVISGNSCPKGLVEDTKPAGSAKISVETITHYLERYAADIIAKKKAAMPEGCPLL